MRIKVKVTKKVLSMSKTCGLQYEGNQRADYTAENCMIKLAINDLFPNSKVLYAGTTKPEASVLKVYHDNSIHVIPLPKEVFYKMQLFDCQLVDTPEEEIISVRESIEPFSFQLRLSKTVIESIGVSTIYKVISESKTLELVATYDTI